MSTPILPTPPEIGLPPSFPSWRPYQEQAIMDSISSPKRFIAQVQPTGSGKSICYVAAAKLLSCRTLILTSTKMLQDQLEKDFDVVVAKGRSNYPCKLYHNTLKCDMGPCRVGHYCPHRRIDCEFFTMLRAAKAAKIVVTNYAFWCHNKKEIIGDFDFLVCDEGHDTPQQLLSTLSVTFNTNEQSRMGLTGAPEDIEIARAYGELISKSLEEQIHDAKVSGSTRTLAESQEFKSQTKLKHKLDKLNTQVNWVVEAHPKGVDFDPLWPSEFAESHLFRGISKILLTSATLTGKILSLLGASSSTCDIFEYPSYFPVQSRPVIHISTVAMRHGMDQGLVNLWLARIDQIIQRRQDKKAVIHAVSYKRCQDILHYSRFKSMMITHRPGQVSMAIKQLKTSLSPKILVSPSCVTGIDLPYTDCEYQIIGKIPFPDLRRKVDKVRKESDKEYGMCFAAQSLQQAVGRGSRAVDDRCETLVIDDQMKWFPYKYKKFFAKWFLDAVQSSAVIPKPLEKL